MDHEVDIRLLEAKRNCATWKYKILIMLKGIPGGENVILAKITKSKEPKGDNPEEALIRYFNN